MKILTEEEVKKLKDAKWVGDEYYEWEDWDDLIEEISHKYIKDDGELRYFEAYSEGILNISEIDRLIFEINKYHYYI